MSLYRPMRLVLLYDICNSDYLERKEYTIFRNALLKNGYYMMQFSVYVKCVNVQTKIEQEINKIKKYIPKFGNIRVIAVTEKQYSNMFVLLGNKTDNEIYNSPERYIKI